VVLFLLEAREDLSARFLQEVRVIHDVLEDLGVPVGRVALLDQMDQLVPVNTEMSQSEVLCHLCLVMQLSSETRPIYLLKSPEVQDFQVFHEHLVLPSPPVVLVFRVHPFDPLV
jgi:hypothetical protein